MNNVRPFSWVLFDADDTLFHFDSFSGLRHLFALYSCEFTTRDYEEYQLINKPLWAEYQKGTISTQEIQQKRFAPWARKLGCTPLHLDNAFIAIMAKICRPIDGVMQLLDSLKGKVGLGIITNGFTQLQQARLDNTGFGHYFDALVISEQVGVAKPHKAIFDHCLTLMGNPLPEHVLMVGDNPISDIHGALNAGLQTCWFNPHQQERQQGISPHIEVKTFAELHSILRDSQLMLNIKLGHVDRI